MPMTAMTTSISVREEAVLRTDEVMAFFPIEVDANMEPSCILHDGLFHGGRVVVKFEFNIKDIIPGVDID